MILTPSSRNVYHCSSIVLLSSVGAAACPCPGGTVDKLSGQGQAAAVRRMQLGVDVPIITEHKITTLDLLFVPVYLLLLVEYTSCDPTNKVVFTVLLRVCSVERGSQ